MNSPPPRVSSARILLSEKNEFFRCLIEILTQDTADTRLTITSIAPAENRANALLETASQEEFDLVMIILNNLWYSSGDRSHVTDDSIGLVRKMVKSFKKPVIALYGWTDSPDDYEARLLDAGASAVFRMPFKLEEMKDAIYRSLGLG